MITARAPPPPPAVRANTRSASLLADSNGASCTRHSPQSGAVAAPSPLPARHARTARSKGSRASAAAAASGLALPHSDIAHHARSSVAAPPPAAASVAGGDSASAAAGSTPASTSSLRVSVPVLSVSTVSTNLRAVARTAHRITRMW